MKKKSIFNKIPPENLVIIFTTLLVLSIFSPNWLIADVAGPGWHLSDIEPITPGAANNVSLPQAAIKTSFPITMARASVQITPEITELARGLMYNPKLIYEFVQNNIDYVPYFGSLKGSVLTLFDKSGNDFDQASLMISLLRESGYTAKFAYGKMTIPGDQMVNWLGVEPGWQGIGNVLPSGGFYNGDVTLYADGTTKLPRVWVVITIDGTDYPFDPAFKQYIKINKLADIGTISGYNRAELLSEVSTGATSGSDYTQNLNKSRLISKMEEYSAGIVSTIREQYPNSSVKELLGGRNIAPEILEGFQANFPFATEDIVIWDDIPDDKTATMQIEHLGINHTFFTPEIAVNRLTLSYTSTDFRPEIRLDGVLIATGNTTSSGSKNNCIITINHPYAANGGTYIDQTSTYSPESGSTYAIISNFGGSTDTLIASRQQKLTSFLYQGMVNSSEAVQGETLNIMGHSWMQQCRLADKMLSRLTDTISIRHHSVGFMAQEAGYYIDVKTAYGSIISIHQDDDAVATRDKIAHFNLAATISSAFEHGILEQKMGSDNPGISTMKLFDIANSEGHKVFFANQSNYTAVRPQLTNYSTATLDDFQSQVNQSRTLVLPADGQLGIGSWKGTGYITKYVSGNSMSLGMIIGGGYYGGYASTPAVVQPPVVVNSTTNNIQSTSTPSTVNTQINTNLTPSANDPVEMAGGAFYHDHTDLAMGGVAPLGLAFTRSYNSNNHLEDKGLGYGWTHNYNVSLSRSSHGSPGLGTRQPVDAASLIAAMYINLDLMKYQDDIKGWMASSLINKWALDQLIDNAVNIKLGKKTMEYIKLADNTWSGPAGITTELVQGTTFRLEERFGSKVDFNEQNKASRITDVNGNSIAFTYDAGKLSGVQDAFGRTLTFGYFSDRLFSVSDSSGRSVSYTYDENNDLDSFTDPGSKIWTFGYDSDHRMTTLTNPLSVTTATNTYDTLGRVMAQIVPRQTGSTQYEFYFSGYRNLEQDEQGNQTIYYFDDQGRSTGMENALGHKSQKIYDGQDHVVKLIDPKMNATIFEFDKNQNLVKTINSDLEETNFFYDTLHRLVQTENPLGHISDIGYNSSHQPTSSTVYPESGVSITSNTNYYANGLLQTSTNPKNITTSMTYDVYGNPLSNQTGTQPSINYDYDSIGRMITLTNQAGTQTSFDYDPRNLLETRADGLGQQTQYTYYDNGLVNTVTDRNSDTTTYTYTPNGKVDTITMPDATTTSFTYNALDRLVAMNDPSGATSYAYDNAGRLTSTTDANGFTLSYEYDNNSNTTKVIYPGSKEVTYTYTDLNQLKTVTNWLSQTATYNYDNAGRLISLINFNGTITTYTYDNASRMKSLANQKTDNTVIASFAFTLDDNGNRTNIIEDVPLSSVPTPSDIAYNYNPEKNRIENADATIFDHDLEGQLALKGNKTFTFDSAHRLATITGSTPSDFTYDGANRRLSATRNGVTTRYIHDPSNNLITTADDTGTIQAYFIYGQGLLATINTSDQTFCYHFDGIGNTIAMTDTSQSVINQYDYTPFGMIIGETETMPQPFKYVGQFGVMAEPDGLYYMRARYYDADTGRFISEDPIGFNGGDVNLYGYTSNNPVNFIDPSGLKIYLKTGNNATLLGTNIKNPLQDALHQSIVVDTTDGQRAFSFGMSGFGLTVSDEWLREKSPTVTLLEGQIYEASYTGGKINATLNTTPEQDEQFVQYLENRLYEKAGYSVGRHNCRKFSQLMYGKAEQLYGKGN